MFYFSTKAINFLASAIKEKDHSSLYIPKSTESNDRYFAAS